MPLVSFILLRGRDGVPVTSPSTALATAAYVLRHLLGALPDGHARQVESDQLGGYNVEATEQEAAKLRTHGIWLAEGQAGPDYFTAVAEMP